MELQNEIAVEAFIKLYPRSGEPLRRWVELVKAAHWKNFTELRRTFPSADYVAPYVIFNIGGNKFRLVAVVVFSMGVVTVERIMTHEEYNRWTP